MRNIMIPSALILAALISAPTMGEELKSGLQVGDSAGAFNVKDCTGPNKGKSLCYRWRYGRNPVVSVFTRKITDDLASLVKQIDNTVAKNSSKKMKL